MSERNASVFLRAFGDYLVETMSFTIEGALVMDGAPQILPEHSTAEALGNAVIAGLTRSHHHMPPRATIARPDADFLAFLGVSSWGKFMEGVRLSSIGADDEMTRIEFIPYQNEGPRGGFTPIEESVHTIPFESPEQLGQAVLDALEQAIA